MNEQYETPVEELPNRGWDSRVRVFRAGREVDTCVLITERYVVFVDTASTPELARDILERVRGDFGSRQPLVVNTHADYDHAWGNAVFATPQGTCPASIIAHRAAYARMTGEDERAYLRARQGAEPRFAGVSLVPPTIAFTGSMCIDGGDLTLELVHTPGHTEDHIAVWVPELRLLLAGDAAEHPFPVVGERAVLPTLIQSLQNLIALQPATVIPCHGGTLEPALLTRNLAHFARLASRMRTAAAASAVPADWSTREDLADAVGYPYEAALRDCEADPSTTSDFYRDVHRLAIRATLADVLADGATPL